MKFDSHRGGRSAADVFFGPSPRSRGRAGRRDDKAEHHTAALCKQVHRALTFALAGEVGDPVVQSLTVMGVSPAPNAGRLAVAVAPRGPADVADVLARLEAVRGLLRARVAAAITRKRAPELTFLIVPHGATPPGGAP